jgi:hypothetical protein
VVVTRIRCLRGRDADTAVTAATEFEAFAGQGLETVTAADLLIPRLTILQALSAQLNPKKPEFIKDAAIGTIVDVGTGEMFPDGVLFLPVLFCKDFLEWAPRASGKGLIKIHSDPAIMDQCNRDNEKNQPTLPNGNYVAETAQFFGLNLTAGRRMCFLPMASTQLKKSRKWLTQATGEKLKRADGSEFLAPIWYRTYSLTTAEESNNEGDWSGWKIERSMPSLEAAEKICHVPWAQLKGEIIAFIESLKSGRTRGDLSSLDTGDHEAPNEKAM